MKQAYHDRPGDERHERARDLAGYPWPQGQDQKREQGQANGGGVGRGKIRAVGGDSLDELSGWMLDPQAESIQQLEGDQQ